MGQLNCAGCECGMTELKGEFNLQTTAAKEVDFSAKSTSPLDRNSTGESSQSVISRYYGRHLGAILRIQAVWRGIQDRKAVLHLIKAQPRSFFNKKYTEETVRSKKVRLRGGETRGVYEYRDGAKYSGEWLGGFRHGIGIMQWSNGSEYSGQWSYGMPSGHGKFTFPNGDKYDGLWRYNKANARTSLLLDPQKMETEVKTDGYGTGHLAWVAYQELAKKDVSSSKRTWQSSKRETLEQAIETMRSELANYPIKKHLGENGRIYVEKLTSKDSIYTGEMLNGLKDGWGRNEWNNGDVYEGGWEANMHSGFGTNRWADGSSHIGFYKDSKKDGIGHYHWEDGSSYLGSWKDNQMHGNGNYTWADGRAYLGEWISGLMHGFGIFLWKDGRKYEGGWFQGKKHGEGVTFASDGSYTRDIWKHGKIVRADV